MIRAARTDEADSLSALAVRSKAHWGYTAAFIAACRDELSVDAAAIASLPTFVYERDGAVLGFYSLEARSQATVELEHLFVEPAAIGAGLGRKLLDHAVRQARAAGHRVLRIASDPHAEAFYLACGAVRVGAAASASIPGRELPLLELTCQPPTDVRPD